MKKRYFLILAVAIIFGWSFTKLKASNTDIWNLSGQGIYNAKDMTHVDSNYNLRLYNGSIFLGDNGLVPSTSTVASITSGGTYGIKVPVFFSTPVAQGSVILASSANVTGRTTTSAVLATTTVLGVADAAYSANTVGYVTIAGYALVLTTGTVTAGQVLVSTDGSNAAGIGGYAGVTTGTEVVGTAIGKAIGPGIATGGLTPVLISLP